MNHLANRALAWQYCKALDGTGRARPREALAPFIAPDAVWNLPQPFNEVTGRDALVSGFWEPLLASLPDLERRTDLLLAGGFDGQAWVTVIGHFLGNFERDWLGVPATGGVATLRFGEFLRVEGEQIVEAHCLLDIPDLMRQAGVRAFPAGLGAEILVPGPATRDGVRLADSDPEESRASLALVDAMLAGLHRYDGEDLASMEQHRYWHPDKLWYGPAGIGTARGYAGYQACHQRPFLRAFPDRRGGKHLTRFGDGPYAASTGWPSLFATHTGGGWMGLPPTGRRITMRVMDWWRREGESLVENWVLIDLIDVLMQMDVDVFDRVAHFARKRG